MGTDYDFCVVDGHDASTCSTTKRVYVVTYMYQPHLDHVLTKDAASY